MTDPGGALIGRFPASRLVSRGLTADLLTAYEPDGQPVVVVALTPEAGADQAWRRSFADLVARDMGANGPFDVAIHASDLHGTQPWAASRFAQGRRGVERLLLSMPGSIPAGVDPTALLGAGPQYGDAGSEYAGESTGPEYAIEPAPAEQPDSFGSYEPGMMDYSAPFSGPPSYPLADPPPSTDPPAPPQPQVSGPPQVAVTPFNALPPQVSSPPFGSLPPQVSSPPFGSLPPQVSSPPSSGVPQPPAGAPPTRRSGESGPAWLAIGLIAAVTALIMVATGFAVYIFRDSTNKGTGQSAAQSTPTTQQGGTSAPLPTASGSPSPSTTRSPLPSTKPTLRKNVQAVSVVGPTWQASDTGLYLFQFNGWPFAFRGTGTENCLIAKVTNLPDANAWGCVDTDADGRPQKINLMIRRCPTTCTKSEQQKMDKDWYDKNEKPKRFDSTTTYAETPKNAQGYYTVDFSHFFAETSGAKLKWQVGVFIQAAPGGKSTVQKQLNDVRSQTPFHP